MIFKKICVEKCLHLQIWISYCFLAYYVGKIIPAEGMTGIILSGIAACVIYAVLVLGLYGRSRQFKALLGRFLKRKVI